MNAEPAIAFLETLKIPEGPKAGHSKEVNALIVVLRPLAKSVSDDLSSVV